MKLNLYLIMIVSLMIFACGSSIELSEEASARMKLDGTWAVPCIDQGGGATSNKAEFSFAFETEKSQITASTELFANTGCNIEDKLFKFEQQGTMILEADTEGNLTTYDATYEGSDIKVDMFIIVLNKITVTPYTDDAITMLESAYSGCDVTFTKQVATDLSNCEQPVWSMNVDETSFSALHMISEAQVIATAMNTTKTEAINEFNNNPVTYTKQ